MKKPLAARILGLAVLYCFVFFVLVIVQFSGAGNFSLPAGAINIRGRYLQSPQRTPQQARENSETGRIDVTGGVKAFFGGLEFNMKEERGKGLILTDADGYAAPVNPEYLITTGNSVYFGLPGGTAIIFNSLESANGMELQINAEFADNISEISVPVAQRRSSLIRDNGQLGVLYNGARYFFGAAGNELESGIIILSKSNSFISYRSRGNQRVFNPEDYIIAQAHNYEGNLAEWLDAIYTRLNQNASVLQNDDDIIAFLSEALRRGNFPTAVSSIPGNFIDSPRHNYRSAPFIGGLATASISFASEEREKTNLITQLTRDKSLNILKEKHIIDYLFTRSSAAIADEVIEIIGNINPEQLTPDYCPGLLEAYEDIKKWRSQINNPVEPLIEQILLLLSENMNLDAEKKLVFARNSGGMDLEYSLRLGKALIYWADDVKNKDWSAIGRSLVLSALSSGGAGAGNLYCILNPGNNGPRAAMLMDNGLWMWTISPNVRASYIDGNLNISTTFPQNMSHYVIIKGVRPFIKVQIYEMDWRTDSQFERYDSSGWVYYPQDQIMIMKIRHRSATENVRIIYRVVEPPPEEEEDTAAYETPARTQNPWDSFAP
ncbi:MAG: hypothetical protein LBQ82_09700 [Treponema sp.]|nr:hypothetical protein [Treponema sp.]